MDRLRRQLAALAAFATIFCALAPHAEAQTTRTRAIILSFEGWNAEPARAAIESGLNAAYDMISEQQAVDTAMQIGVDPSTPEGLGAVVARLHIQLVIGGSVSGRGARATTTIWVTDTSGNQLATRTAGAPTGRGFEGELTTAALQACGEAVAQLPPPTTSGGRTTTPGPGPGPGPDPTYQADPESGGTATPPPPPPEPEYDPDYDIENEVAGRPRGQGHGSTRRDPDHGGGGGGGTPGRWNQPYFRALAGVDIRNMSASTSGGTGGNPANVDNLPVPFAPLIGLWLETRPFAGNDDALRGLYGYLNTEFSVGQTYYRVDDMSPDPQQRDLYLYGLDFGVGYAGTIAEVVELIGTVGAGVDGLGLADAVTDGSTWGGSAHASCGGLSPSSACAGTRDFPSIQAWYIRPDIQLRVRLVEDLLMLEGNFAGRIVVSWGDLANADFGSPGGGGIDWSIGLAGIIDPGFTWRARFGYSGNYVTFSDPGQVFMGDLNNGWSRDSATIEAWRITLGIGWAFR